MLSTTGKSDYRLLAPCPSSNGALPCLGCDFLCSTAAFAVVVAVCRARHRIGTVLRGLCANSRLTAGSAGPDCGLALTRTFWSSAGGWRCSCAKLFLWFLFFPLCFVLFRAGLRLAKCRRGAGVSAISSAIAAFQTTVLRKVAKRQMTAIAMATYGTRHIALATTALQQCHAGRGYG